jgi:hypothetical protein
VRESEILCPSDTPMPFTSPGETVHGTFAVHGIPDASLTLAILTAVLLFFLFHGATSLFSDTDTGWHIRLGERILQTGSLPHSDPYSFSRPGAPWVAWEWGSDILMALVYRVAGNGGIALLYGAGIAASVWMWARLSRAIGGNFLMIFLFFVPVASTTALHWLARPHIFSWLFLLGAVWLCERAPQRLSYRQIVLPATGAALWSNLHASFFLGPVIALIYACGAWLKPRIWAMADHGQEIGPEPPPGVFLRMAFWAALGSFANPAGSKLHRHVIAYLADSALLDRISEFRSFSFHDDGAARIMATLALCAAGAFASLAIAKPSRFLLSMLILAMALKSVRSLPLAALLLLPLANASLTRILTAARGLAPSPRRHLDRILRYGDGLAAIDRTLSGIAVIPLFALLIFFAIRADAGFSNTDAPVAASSVIAALPADARIFAPDTFGGYLIYRFSGERKVFFDGRSDFYGSQFLDRYLLMADARPGWEREFRRWHFSHALLRPDCALVSALEAQNWRELFRDRTAILLGRPQ